MPNGTHTGCIVVFNDVHGLVNGRNPLGDTARTPPELGVGQYNASNMGVLPSYGLWVRHVNGLLIKNCSLTMRIAKAVTPYCLMSLNTKISSTKMVRASDNEFVIKTKNSSPPFVENVIYYNNAWGDSPKALKEETSVIEHH